MGSNFDFKNNGNDPGREGRSTLENYPLAQEPSLYSLTFDELQNTMGKDFGSMNMDELLKSIWNVEETQTMGASHSGAVQGGGGGYSSGYLPRQGSLTLPRTLSQKTVDEVWKDMSKEFVTVKDVNGVGGSSMAQREYTLGEITLEEFLVKAGVVREDVQLAKNPTNNPGVFGDLAFDGSNSLLNFCFQQADRSVGLPGGSNQIGVHSPILPLNINGIRSNQQHLGAQQEQRIKQQEQPQQNQQQQKTLFPKLPTLAYGVSVAMPISGGLGSPRIRDGIVKTSDQAINNNTSQNTALQGGGMGMVGLGAGGLAVASGSPAVSSDGIGKSNGELSSLSPVPYVFNGGFRGRKSSTLEKVVERRQRRMIKNRESAARSRARKQAYTMELEEEVAKLKEENEELMKKQAKIMEMQKNQVLEALIAQPAAKRRSLLRRTQTSPW